jgi:hypothetical protein
LGDDEQAVEDVDQRRQCIAEDVGCYQHFAHEL